MGRTNWLAVVLMILSIYSTVFSGIYVAIAFKGPRYLFIRTKGVISPSSASLLTAVVAKTIELSFVTVFVAFLGQVSTGVCRNTTVSLTKRIGVVTQSSQ